MHLVFNASNIMKLLSSYLEKSKKCQHFHCKGHVAATWGTGFL